MKSRAQVNKLFSLLMAFLLSLQLFVVPGFSVDNTTGEPDDDASILVDNPIDFIIPGEPFVDVMQGSVWHDDICDLYDAGIFFGVAEGQFAPYQTITARQVLVTYARMTGVDSSDTNAIVRDAIDKRMLSMMAFSDPDGALSREEAIVLLFKCLGAIPSVEPNWAVNLDLESDVYEDPIYTTGRAFEFIINITRELGLFDIDPVGPNLPMTRGEYAMLLNTCRKMLLQDANSPITQLGFAYLPVSATENYKSEVPVLWAHVITVPIEVVRVYHAAGYQILLDNDYIDNLLTGSLSKVANIVGLFSTEKKSIYAKRGYSVVHEMGHFAHAFMAGHDDIEPLYDAEKDYASAVLTAYAGTSSKEYFAECFVFFAQHRGDVLHLSLMRELMPQTYEYFVNLQSNGWLKPGETELQRSIA